MLEDTQGDTSQKSSWINLLEHIWVSVFLNPVIMVENICTLILAVHTILPHFKANFPVRVILVSPYT